MGKLEERENYRKASIVGSIAGVGQDAPGGKKGRPKADRETKKRVSLSVLPSLYEDIQKIAYMERRSTSDLVAELLEQYRETHGQELAEYGAIAKSE